MDYPELDDELKKLSKKQREDAKKLLAKCDELYERAERYKAKPKLPMSVIVRRIAIQEYERHAEAIDRANERWFFEAVDEKKKHNLSMWDTIIQCGYWVEDKE